MLIRRDSLPQFLRLNDFVVMGPWQAPAWVFMMLGFGFSVSRLIRDRLAEDRLANDEVVDSVHLAEE